MSISTANANTTPMWCSISITGCSCRSANRPRGRLPELLKALQPIWQHNREVTQRLAAQVLPEMATLTVDFPGIVNVFVSLFRGEALDSFMIPPGQDHRPGIELAQLICDLLAQHYRAAANPTLPSSAAGGSHETARSK